MFSLRLWFTTLFFLVNSAEMSTGKGEVLVTGGAGFIGSHTVVEMVQAGYTVTIIDNYSNSRAGVLARINQITGKPEAVTMHNVDLRDKQAVRTVFSSKTFVGVIHFAAFKAVGESKQKPLMYYDNNMVGMINLLTVMDEFKCKVLVFSSSCTVYGAGEPPLDENKPTGFVTNAYAGTKFMAEMMLKEICACDPSWSVCILRYFNPVAAHPSGLLGEDPQGIPNCLMPYALQVLVGRLPQLTVYGTDYPTPDGTALRDYIHVVDLAVGHLDALAWMDKEIQARAAAGKPAGFCDVFNLGTGNGVSVLELVHAMEEASGKKIPVVLGARRAGDVTAAYAAPTKAATVLGWKAKYDIKKMCEDAWRWQSNNPDGYA